MGNADQTAGTGRTAVVVGIALAICALATASAGSQVRSAPPPNPDAEARAITQMVTAAEVADWARERRDPQAMIVAARMLDEIRTRRQTGDDLFLTAQVLLEEAEAMAGDNPAIRADILRLRSRDKGVRASPFGPGPIVVVRRLRAREVYGFDVEARRSEVLRVAAIGDGDTNIDLILRDQNGVVICADGSQDHYPVCTVTRPQSGTLRIEVVNRGAVWSRVQILTN